MRRLVLLTAFCSLVAGCGSRSVKTVTVTSSASGTPAASSTSTSTPASSSIVSSGSTTSTTTAAPVHLSMFRSPSGNVGCELVAGFGRCDIANRNWKPPPKPASCPLDYGQGLEVGRSRRGHLVCAGDTALNPQARVLAYGQSSRAQPITCSSASTGMTCTNTLTGHGFFISAQSYRTF